MIKTEKLKAGFAVILIALLVCSAALMLSSCRKSDGGNGGGGNGGSSGTSTEEGKIYKTEDAFVAGKCYELTGLKAQDEEYDDDMIKFMYDMDKVADYMHIYFDKSGKAFVLSVIYGKDVVKAIWSYDKDGILLQADADVFEIEDAGNGTITTVQNDEDGDIYTLTLKETDDIPDQFKQYVK